MPFQDTECVTFITQLNVNVICEELETMLEKQYTEDIDEGSKFWQYVYELEFQYNCYLSSNPTNPLTFWDWFLDNYNNIYAYEEIEQYFVDEDIEEDRVIVE